MHVTSLSLVAFASFASALATGDPVVLKAVSQRQPLSKRDVTFIPSLQQRDIFYSDERSSRAGHDFVAKVQFTPNLPTVLIEEIDWSIQDLRCSHTAVHLNFDHLDNLQKARDAWSQHEKFYVVSSHLQCNEEGHRSGFLVSDVQTLGDSLTLTLMIRAVAWSEMAHSMTVDFGENVALSSTFKKPLSGYDGLRKRHASVPKDAGAKLARGLPKQPYPSPPSDSLAPQNVSGADINLNITNKIILPRDPNEEQSDSFKSLSIPNATFRCTSCSVAGRVELQYGQIVLGNLNTTVKPSSKFSFIKKGFFEVDIRKLQASLDLETVVTTNISNSQWSTPLPAVPLTPFTILGIANIGPIFLPQVEGSLAADSPLSLTYGFDFTVPENSSIKLALSEKRNFTTSGLNETNFKLHPVSTNSSQPTVQMSFAFKPQVLVGIDFMGQTAGVGMYANVPQLQLDIKQVAGVNKKCEKANNSTANGTVTDQVLGFFAGNLTQITPSLNMKAGFTEDIDLGFAPPAVGLDESFGIFPDVAPLPTTCLSWNSKAAALTAIPAYNTGQTNADDATLTTSTPSPTSTAKANASASKIASPAAATTKPNGGTIISIKLKATCLVFGIVNIVVATVL